MRASTTESWTGRWLLAARSPWARRSSTVAGSLGSSGSPPSTFGGSRAEQVSASLVDADPSTWWPPGRHRRRHRAPQYSLASRERTASTNQTLRMVLTPAAGGSMRIAFEPLRPGHVRRRASAATHGAIVAGTDRTVARRIAISHRAVRTRSPPTRSTQ
jgi:hypothetical protein